MQSIANSRKNGRNGSGLHAVRRPLHFAIRANATVESRIVPKIKSREKKTHRIFRGKKSMYKSIYILKKARGDRGWSGRVNNLLLPLTEASRTQSHWHHLWTNWNRVVKGKRIIHGICVTRGFEETEKVANNLWRCDVSRLFQNTNKLCD